MTLCSPAVICDAETDRPLQGRDRFTVPPEVQSDADRLAKAEYGREPSKAAELARQMLDLYAAARDKDIIIVFNPGGWGWATVAQMPLWASILKGMQETLAGLGQKVLVANYQRANHSLSGALTEFLALSNLSRAKGRELATRADFLTRHLPCLKVILAGESNGAAMAEDAMGFLRANARVFSVQTGTPFWAPSEPFVRSLIINHNGVEPDTFSNGDARRWFTANVQALFGKYKTEQGNILLYIGAPGHVYNWDYPVVREKIIKFLKEEVIEPSKPVART